MILNLIWMLIIQGDADNWKPIIAHVTALANSKARLVRLCSAERSKIKKDCLAIIGKKKFLVEK